MCCSSPRPPAAPDYVGAAQAQGLANWQTALANAFASNPNVTTPYGSQQVTWSQLPGEGEYERWQANINQQLSPEQQTLYDQSQRINQNLGGIAESGIDRVGNTLGTPYSSGGLPARVSSVAGGPIRTSVAGGGPIRTGGAAFGYPGLPQNAAESPSGAQGCGDMRLTHQAKQSSSGSGQPSAGLDLPGIQQGMSGFFDQTPEGTSVREQHTGGTLLRGPGGSATYTSPSGVATPFDRSAPEALAAASPEIAKAWQQNYGTVGPTAAAKLQYGADLSKLPDMPQASDATRKSVTDALYGQMTSRLDPQWQQAEDQNRNRLLQQGFTEGSTGFDRANENFGRSKNDAYNTALNQAVMSGGQEMQRQYDMGMGARQQGWAEQAGNVGLGNSAAQSLYGMGATDTSLANAAQNQAFNQSLAGGSFTNAAQNQAFNQGLAGGNFTNAARGQQLAEDLSMRQLPLNELNALRTGTQLQNPTFPGFSGVNSQAGNIAGAVGQQGQWDTGLYNAKAGQYGQNMSTLGDLGSAAMMASSCG